MSDPAPLERLDAQFKARLAAGDLPAPATGATVDPFANGLTKTALVDLFESQLVSRRLDYEARRLGREKRGYYSIGSSGHEGNAAIARAFTLGDPAFLHYRSGAFLIERSRQRPGSTPIWDMALSFVASSEDPMSGGRHKVLGARALNVPPQTSTIASHLPKAVGAGVSIALARTLKLEAMWPRDAVAICSFGDASANHSTSTGAINAAAWTSYRGAPLPLVFVCEDNGIGISVGTPPGWIASTYGARPGLAYVFADGLDLVDAWRGAKAAEALARGQRKPVFLHLRTVRLMGHAGSDVESAYRPAEQIAAAEAQDPLLHSARILIEAGAASREDIQAIDARLSAQVRRAIETATGRAKLATAAEVMAPITPPLEGAWREGRIAPSADPARRAAAFEKEARALAEPQHMSRLISLALADLLAEDERAVVFGEDVGKKGGVYGATVRLQEKFGPARVFDTLLDEQTILGLAIGLAHNGFRPIPEIQFLAYVHNAEDQIRGEASTLSFFSNGQFANPMVIRIAGLAYQKGFGGHFHNDNSVNVFRDVPGVILACPSTGADAAKMLREAQRLARDEGRVVVFLEPIALYPVRDLHADGDGLMTALYPDPAERISFGEVGAFGDGTDLAIVSFANGAYLARRAQKRLADDFGIASRVVDLRWLNPLPMDALASAIAPCQRVLIVDECRRTGSVSEEVFTRLVEMGWTAPLRRLNALDSFIALGPAATATLPSEASILAEALAMCGREPLAQAAQ